MPTKGYNHYLKTLRSLSFISKGRKATICVEYWLSVQCRGDWLGSPNFVLFYDILASYDMTITDDALKRFQREGRRSLHLPEVEATTLIQHA